jgi:hypothetical protein
MAARMFNERSGVEVTAHFSDATGLPAIPASVHWNLLCDTTDTVLQPDTVAEPVIVSDESGVVDCYVSLTIPGALNVMQGNDRRELKTLLVIADKDRDSEYSQEYQYYVRNVKGRS